MLSRESPWSEKPPAMRTEVYWVPGPWPGRLGVVPRPRGGDWLADEVRSWKASQIDVVASLLTPEEAAELDLLAEEALARDEGLARLVGEGRRTPDGQAGLELVEGQELI